jgi:hypothetical protein
MFTFNVIKEQNGWTIQMGGHMTAPFRSRDMAIREAKRMADAICCYGEITEVTVEAADPNEPVKRIKGTGRSFLEGVASGC